MKRKQEDEGESSKRPRDFILLPVSVFFWAGLRDKGQRRRKTYLNYASQLSLHRIFISDQASHTEVVERVRMAEMTDTKHIFETSNDEGR